MIPGHPASDKITRVDLCQSRCHSVTSRLCPDDLGNAVTSASGAGSYQVLVFAGIAPVTGKRNYLTESTRDEKQAERILRRLLNEVEEQRNARNPGGPAAEGRTPEP